MARALVGQVSTEPMSASVRINDLKGEPAALLALASGQSVEEAAREAGVTARTLRRRKATAEYRSEIARLRREYFDAAGGRLASGLGPAISKLFELLHAQSEHVQIKAVQLLLEHGTSLNEVVGTEERIESLEQVVLKRTWSQGSPNL